MNLETLEVLQRNISLLTENSVPEYEYIPQHDTALPSLEKLSEVVDLLRAVVFPGYHGQAIVNSTNLEYHLGVNIERLYGLLSEQIYNGLSFNNDENAHDNKASAQQIALTFIDKIPELKRLLATDIDIHPGAQIGEYFSIDHGTGVVIGETTVIGSRVRIYQGVTLGAKRFTYDEDGNPLNIPRHPILEDNVVVYANANILGRITIGRDSTIGGNVWLTADVPPGSRILQQKAIVSSFYDGAGI